VSGFILEASSHFTKRVQMVEKVEQIRDLFWKTEVAKQNLEEVSSTLYKQFCQALLAWEFGCSKFKIFRNYDIRVQQV
jgi:hypothetical protein